MQYKGPNLTSIDPVSQDITELFNPRIASCTDHFETTGGEIIGKTAVGRATVLLLQMNAPRRRQLRESIMKKD